MGGASIGSRAIAPSRQLRQAGIGDPAKPNFNRPGPAPRRGVLSDARNRWRLQGRPLLVLDKGTGRPIVETMAADNAQLINKGTGDFPAAINDWPSQNPDWLAWRSVIIRRGHGQT
jgi:hypothetical protein